MRFLVVLLALLPFSNAVDSGARELWQQQMKKLDKMIADSNAEEMTKTHTKQIGLPFFGIGFESDLGEIETTAHSLRPQDVDIVAAMGDSLSAANGAGANTVAGLILEYRGMCFSVGGDDEVENSITMPNILKKFNSRVDGFSTGVGPAFPRNREKYGFNVAVPGARADDMLGQAQRLIELLKTDTRSNFAEDWKVLTLFIGGNDLCVYTRDSAAPEVYIAHIKDALDLLHKEVPRMFVNVVDILDIYLLPYVGYGYGSSAVCRIMQRIFCDPVVQTMTNKTAETELREINRQYQVQLDALISSGRYDTRDDFTVVLQPFLRNSVLPYTEYGEVDATYFAPDCFHFSDIGHAMGAINLWNNMLEPVGQKTTVWAITDLKVPTKERPYFFTSKNSDIQPPAEPTSEPLVEIWVIAVIAILTFLLIVQTLALVVFSGSRKARVPEVSFHDDEKSGHVNYVVTEQKSAL